MAGNRTGGMLLLVAGAVWGGIVVTAAPANGASAPAQVFLTRGDQPAVYLDLPATLDSEVTEAVDDLTDCIARATGATLPRSPEPGLIPLHIGQQSAFDAAPAPPASLGEEGSYLRVAADAIWVTGATPLGTQHGIYTLLHELGFRWVLPGALGECLPASGDLSLTVGDRIEAPEFRYRELACGSNSAPGADRLRLWQRRNRMHAPKVIQGHNLTATLSRVAPFKDRPDLYALLEGERKATQVCTSNPEAVALVIQSIKAYLDRHPDLEAYSLCPDDNFYFCECDACRALDSGHLDRGGLMSVSDRYQVFLNQVIEGVSPTHPDVLITTYAYNPNHTDPPQVTPVHPNTAVFCAPNIFCSIHGVGDAACASQQDLFALLGEWRSRTEHLYLFEYDPEPYCGGLPWPLWRAHAGSYPRFKALGVKGSLILAQSSWAPYFLSYYIVSQMLWDSSLDPEALYTDVLQDFFGPAAPDIRRYYDTLESDFRAFSGTALWGMNDYPRYFPRATVQRAGEALAAAEGQQPGGLVADRLKMLRLAHDMCDAYLGIRTGDYDDFPAYRADMDRFDAAIRGLVALGDELMNADYARAKSGIAMSERFAPEQGFVNRWLLCGPFENLGMDGHDAIYDPERELDLAASYFGKNDAPAVWRPNSTPADTAYIRLADEFEVTDWVCAYARCWIRNEGPAKEIEFRVGSNDSIKVFLNDNLIWDNKTERVASVDDDVIPVTLPEGVSDVMLKVGQAGYDWGFYFRISERGTTQFPEGITVADVPLSPVADRSK